MKKAIVNSLPKAGTHLLSRFLVLCGMIEIPLFFRQVPFNPFTVPFQNYGYPVGIDYIRVINRSLIDRRLNALENQQFMIGHLGYSHCFIDLAERYGVQTIVMLRDPRAVLNSFVHHVVSTRRHPMRRFFNDLSMERRYETALRGGWTGKAYLEPMANRCRALQPWLDEPNVLKVRFEDLVGARGGGEESRQVEITRTIADRLEIPEESRSKAQDALFGASRTFRSGQIESWRKEIPASLLPEIATQLGPVLTAWGYESVAAGDTA